MAKSHITDNKMEFTTKLIATVIVFSPLFLFLFISDAYNSYYLQHWSETSSVQTTLDQYEMSKDRFCSHWEVEIYRSITRPLGDSWCK